MIRRLLSEVSAAVGGRLLGDDLPVSSVTTDSRRVVPGGLFVALRGEHADGHDFVDDAVARGAVAALVRVATRSDHLVVVPDPGHALLALAADERTRMGETTVVGITGANGKTSTKDLTAAILATRFRTHASPASFNNEIGLPMTLLGARPDVEVVVAEMGARHEGDVTMLCDVARPQLVVVTNVGVAHMEIFGSWDAIVRAGSEPVAWLGEQGTAILNADDPVVLGYGERTGSRVLTFGLDGAAEVRAVDVRLDEVGRASFELVYGGERGPVRLAVAGEHMVPNALAAVACGIALGLSVAECATGLEGARISAWRMETFRTADGVTVVNDAYNANPESMAAALKAARWMAGHGRLAAVLGHMAELGPISFEEHERLGELIVRVGVERLVTVGEEATAIARAAIREGQLAEEVAICEGPEEAEAELRAWARSGDVVLLKGSRVVGLERLAEALR